MIKGFLICYWYGTEVDKLPITYLSDAGMIMKIMEYRRWKGIEGDLNYEIVIDCGEVEIKKAPVQADANYKR